MGYLYWSSKYLDTVDTELALIGNLQRITNTPPEISSATASSVSNCRRKTQISIPRGKQEPSFSFCHKRFKELIKMISEEKRLFFCSNIHTDPENFRPILDSGYLVTKDADGSAKKLAIIRTGCQKTNSISASEPLADPSIEY